MYSSREAVGLSILGMLLYWPSHSSADQSDLLSLVRAGHRSARDSIHSFAANVTFEIKFPKKPLIVIKGKHWRSFNDVRVQEEQGQGVDDYLVKDSEIRQVGRAHGPQRGQIKFSATRKPATDVLCLVDVWSLMMIDLGGPNGGRYDFDRFLEYAKEPPKATQEKKDGHNCIRVDLRYDFGGEIKVSLWHDVDHNYLIWKKTLSVEGSPSKFDSEILEFSEPLPGVFIPIKCRRQPLPANDRDSDDLVTLSDVQVNKPIPKSVFQLPTIPSGTILDDRIQRTSYPIDSNWHPLGPATPLPQTAKIVDSNGREPDYDKQSSSEPVPLSRWIILVSLLILITACICLLYRHFRLRYRVQRLN